MGKVIRLIKFNFLFCTTCSDQVYRTTYCLSFYETSDYRFEVTTISFYVLSCSAARSIVHEFVDVYNTFCIRIFSFYFA